MSPSREFLFYGKPPRMRLMLLAFLLCGSPKAMACARDLSQHAKPWHEGLDFDAIEKRLLTSKIVNIISMKEYLRGQGHRTKKDKDVYVVELECGLKAVAKPEAELWSSLGERTGYQIVHRAGLRLMAPTVIRHFPELGNRAGSFQLLVESPFNLRRPDDARKAYALLSEKDRSDLVVAQFILGRFDIHPGNLIIDPTGAPLLFDIEEIHFLQHVRYGDFPYVRRMKHLKGIRTRPLPEDTFPFDKEVRFSPRHLGELWMAFGSLISFNHLWNLQRLLNEGYFRDGVIRYVLWDESVWLYRASKQFPPLYTEVYSQATLDAFRDINFSKLDLSPEFSPRHLKGFGERRDQILRASESGKIIP